MPRTYGGNRTDLLTPKPAQKAPGQPNGRPPIASIPGGLPYGEGKQLQGVLRAAPRPTRASRPMPVEPAAQDMTSGPGHDSAVAAATNWNHGVQPLMRPTERPDEPITAGSIGQPDSVLGSMPPQGIGSLLAQMAAMTGSSTLSALATRAQATGV